MLHPSKIPAVLGDSYIWNSSFNLPNSAGHTVILVIVDMITKAAEFIACNSAMRVEVTANLSLQHIYVTAVSLAISS